MNKSSLEMRIASARVAVFQMLDMDTTKLSGACAYHATIMAEFLGDAEIVAGSYQWQFRKDDGHSATHVSCIFDDFAKQNALFLIENPEKINSHRLLHLPEMHIWLKWRGVVLDISTFHLPEFALRTVGQGFEKGFMPPDYLLGPKVGPNSQWVYDPDPIATKLAHLVSKNIKDRIEIVY